MAFFVLALLTHVEVLADTTFVPNTLNRGNFTVVTDYAIMDNLCLLSRFLTKVIYHKSLECLNCVVLNLFSKNLGYVSEELIV